MYLFSKMKLILNVLCCYRVSLYILPAGWLILSIFCLDCIAVVKADVFFQPKSIDFVFLHGNKFCGYLLEAPQRIAPNEYPQGTCIIILTLSIWTGRHEQTV